MLLVCRNLSLPVQDLQEVLLYRQRLLEQCQGQLVVLAWVPALAQQVQCPRVQVDRVLVQYQLEEFVLAQQERLFRPDLERHQVEFVWVLG